jgi:Ser/Thr protein kinase RdoA (MazF antagonist)
MGPMDGPTARELAREAIEVFDFGGSSARLEPLTGGHIHDNFLVTSADGRYVLQRLNDNVFLDVDAVLSNVERVVAHLESVGRRCPQLVETRNGALSHRTTDGSAWRAFRFLEGTVGRTTVTGATDAFETALAFADYLVALADLADPPLAETIGRFHDLRHRMTALDVIVLTDPIGRGREVRLELDRARRLGQQVADALGGAEGHPVRTVHNDAKLSNVRFDAETGLATCVVDLDTTMPGSVRSDVGELVRTLTTHAPEDALDETTVDFDLELLEALATGYFTARPCLEPAEVCALALAGPEMAVENAVRFLTDHLAGDRYFAVGRPDQNLDRCRTQLRLTELLLESHAESDACFVRAARHSGALARQAAEQTEEIP